MALNVSNEAQTDVFRPGLEESMQKRTLAFGSLAIAAPSGVLNPWLCIPTF